MKDYKELSRKEFNKVAEKFNQAKGIDEVKRLYRAVGFKVERADKIEDMRFIFCGRK